MVVLGPDGGWTTAEAALLKEAKEKQGKHYCFFLSLSLYSPFFLFVKILPTSMIENLNLRLCSDQMEEWTTAEAALFEEAMEKHGKTFNDIWTDYLPWKTVKVRFIVRYSKRGIIQELSRLGWSCRIESLRNQFFNIIFVHLSLSSLFLENYHAA